MIPPAARSRLGAVLFVTSMISAAGCGTLTSDHPGRFIIVHKEGHLVDLDRRPMMDVAWQEKEWPRIRAAIDAYVSSVPEGHAKLLVYVHGGLTTYQGALDGLASFHVAQDAKTDSGELANPHLREHHLLFVNWDSSLATSIVDDLFVLRLGRSVPAWGVPSSPFVAGQRLMHSGLGAPQSLGLQLSNAWDSLVRRERTDWPWCTSTTGTSEGTGWVIGNAALFSGLYPLRALTVPVIQGFGMPAWDTMKRRAELAVSPKLRPGSESSGGVHRLLAAMRRQIPGPGLWRTAQGTEPHKLAVTLVGHSMGTMVLNHVLQDFADLFFARIVYLAAAAGVDEVRGAVLPYLDRHENAQFWAFSLSETREALEWNYLDVYDRGSLLVWIDHYFERINKPGDRTFGRAKNLRRYFSPAEVAPAPRRARQVFLVKFGNGSGDPERHGDLNEPKFVERALKVMATECPR